MSRRYVSGKPHVTVTGDWINVSYEMTWAVPDIAGREDLVVKMAPMAGFDDSDFDAHGKLRKGATPSMGVTYHDEGVIEISPRSLPAGVRPQDMHPLQYGDRENYPETWGVLTHEAAHANHTRWPGALAGRELTREEMMWFGAAKLLEESRIEKRQVERRPQDYQWLAASAAGIALKEISEELNKTPLSGVTRQGAARIAALILARVDGGSLDPSPETSAIEALVRSVFTTTYPHLRDIWRDAQQAGDDDTAAMMLAGRRWYELTGDSGSCQPQPGLADGALSVQAQAVIVTLTQLAHDAELAASGESGARRRREKAAAEARAMSEKASEQAREKARRTFHEAPRVGDVTRTNPIQGFRNPTREELALARATRRALQNAYTPERAARQLRSALPPGRLSGKAAVQGQALRTMNLPDTSEPFRRKERRRVAVPPLKVAIVQDVSGSQGAAAAAAVSGAWALSKAAEGIDDAQVAMVTFSTTVTAVTGPRDKMPKVPVLSTPGSSHLLHQALQAVEGELGLMRPGAARLVVILTDGAHEKPQLDVRQSALRRLAQAGVHVLWFVTSGSTASRPYGIPGVRVFDGAAGQFDKIPLIITQEAVKTLETETGRQ